MAKNVGVEVLGIPELKQFLKGKNAKFLAGAEKGVSDASLFVEGQVKKDIATKQWRRADGTMGPSVDTGRFLNSVSSTSRGLEGEVFTDVEYAKYLEYGTSSIRPRRHFRNTAARNKDNVRAIIKSRIGKV